MKITRRSAVKTLALAISAAGSTSLPSFAQNAQNGTPIATDGARIFPAPKSVLAIPRSPVLKGIEWLGEEIPYPEPEKKGDTFPVTWAADDNIYSSAGDPVWPNKPSGLDVERFTGMAPHYRVEQANPMQEYTGAGGCGPKPTGFISVKGVLYLAFQNMTGAPMTPPNSGGIMMDYGHGYDAQIVHSRDFGKTWQPELKSIAKPMFPGRTFACPAFINFGKDNQGARDHYVYAMSGEGWDNGSHLRLGRVPATDILNVSAWEWVAGFGARAAPQWTSSMEASVPVLTHPGYLGYVDMTYLRAVRRYVILGWHHKVKSNPDMGSELVIYDSPEPWGPFTLTHHGDPWETAELNPYNPRLPLKWFDPVKLEGWMLFSGSWRKGGTTPHYRSHVRRFRFLRA